MLTKLCSAVLLVTVLCLVSLAQPAEAFRSYFRYHDGDPHAYQFEPRRYYPYYGSHYWRPANKVRRRPGIKSPPYYQAWGLKKRHWRYRRHRFRHGQFRW